MKFTSKIRTLLWLLSVRAIHRGSACPLKR